MTDSPNDSNEFGLTPLLSMEPRMAKHYELPLTKNKDSNSGKIQWFLVIYLRTYSSNLSQKNEQ